jgi:FlaA1/EpsC-like NDP-sugar epimerase
MTLSGQRIREYLATLHIAHAILVWDILVCSLSLPFTHRLILGTYPYFKQIIIFSLLTSGVFILLRSWRGDRRYIKLNHLYLLIGAAILVNMIFYPFAALVGYLHPLAPFLSAVISILLISIPRFVEHIQNTHRVGFFPIGERPNTRIPALFLSDDPNLIATLEARASDPAFIYDILGFCASVPPLSPIRKWRYFGNPEVLPRILENLIILDEAPKRILVSESLLDNEGVRQKLLTVIGRGMGVLVVDSGLTQFRPLNDEDLIGRAILTEGWRSHPLTDEIVAIVSSGKPLAIDLVEES